MTRYRNILIIKPGAIGDLLQISPVIRAIRRSMPGARITMLVGNGTSCDLFRYNAGVHDCIVFDKRGEQGTFRGFRHLCSTIRARRFDLVINFQRSNLKAWVLVAAAFPSRVLVYHKARGRVVHAVQNHLESVVPLGIDPVAADKSLEFFTGSEADGYAEELFFSAGFTGKQVIALNPGASHPVNRWATASFARLADRLSEELPAKVVIVGGKDDVSLAGEIAGATRHPPLDLTGKTTLLQLGAVLKRCSIMVSADTGPMHMATAVGTRVVALFGAADPARTGPVGAGHRVIQAHAVSCVPCRSRRCDSSTYMACMDNISIEEVFAAIRSMLGGDQD